MSKRNASTKVYDRAKRWIKRRMFAANRVTVPDCCKDIMVVLRIDEVEVDRAFKWAKANGKIRYDDTRGGLFTVPPVNEPTK